MMTKTPDLRVLSYAVQVAHQDRETIHRERGSIYNLSLRTVQAATDFAAAMNAERPAIEAQINGLAQELVADERPLTERLDAATGRAGVLVGLRELLRLQPSREKLLAERLRRLEETARHAKEQLDALDTKIIGAGAAIQAAEKNLKEASVSA